MRSDNDINVQDNFDNRRKRINRLKKIIVMVVILLILIPTIGCILLGIQVSRLQKQVNDMSALYGLSKPLNDVKDESYAFAAVKTDDDTIIIPSITPFLQYMSDTTSDTNKNTVTDDKNKALGTDNTNKTSDTDITNKTSDTDNMNLTTDNEKDKDNNTDSDISTGIYAGKKVYLTFDDGPSEYTAEILDTLAEYDVKATFFVIGKTDDKSKEMYKRIVNEGHTLGMHSYSHKYQKIYNSVEDFDKDFTKLWKLLYDTTGYKPSIYRFPGGSDNLVNKNGMDDFINYLNDKNIVYFDWNAVSGDATNIEYSKKQLVDNILKGVAGKERSIVLMHDSQTKKSTADSLPKLIKALVSGGAQILPLDNTVAPIQMIKADSVK